jgi:hypothetical protein
MNFLIAKATMNSNAIEMDENETPAGLKVISIFHSDYRRDG